MQAASNYIPMDRRQALIRQQTLPDRASGAVLFADISGFTPFTEALAQEIGPQRGAEELTRKLNEVYNALIAEVHRYGGSVMSFSGDAITCWLDGDDGLRGIASALNMQAVMKQFASFTTPGGTEVSLGIKTAVVTGPVRRFIVGNPDIQLIDALAGRTVDHVAMAEHQAERGDVIVSANIALHHQDKINIREWREDEESGRRFAVVAGFSELIANQPWPELSGDLPEEQARQWLWSTIYERLNSVQGQFLAEMRLATALFLQFTGIDYDHDPEAAAKLNAYISWVEEIIHRHEGTLLQLTIGDKGSYLYAAFGAPVAHDDDPARAVASAIALQNMPATLKEYIRDVRIGVTQGQVRAGAYGADTRRTYGVLGDKVNLSARLMALADPGQILVDFEVYRRTQQRWQYETLNPVRVKGKAGLIRVYRPTGKVVTTQRSSASDKIIGRQTELAQLTAALQAAQQGETRVLFIEGEAGIGKSRLAIEIARMIREHGLPGLLGEAQSIEQQTPYRVWRDIFSTYFDLDNIADLAQRREQVQMVMQDVAPDQLYRLPLLNDILNLDLPETELTAALQPEVRQESLVVLLITLLRVWARERPLILMLEDAQWLDSLSWEFTVQMVRALYASHDPMLLVVVLRPLDPHSLAGQQASILRDLPTCNTINLTNMSQEETVALVTFRLGLRAGDLPETVAELVRTRADGNPFIAEEVVYTLRDQGIIAIEPDANNGHNRCHILTDLEQAANTLPDTVQGLILARIDQLTPEQQLMLKVAAVIGRSFAFTPFQYLYNQYADGVRQRLQTELGFLNERELTELDVVGPPDLIYIFKHIITQEVAYQTLLFGQRKELHQRVAEWYETNYGERQLDDTITIPATAAFVLPLLAHHYHFAENSQQEHRYARLAGEQAARQYANEEAARYLSRALDLTPEDDPQTRYELYLVQEAIFNLQGKREDQAQALSALATLADGMGDESKQAQVALRRANYARQMGEQMITAVAAQHGIEYATKANQPALQAEGHFILGKSQQQQGKYEEALSHLQHAVTLAEASQAEHIEADSLLQLGVTHFYLNNYEPAISYMQQALALYHNLNDRKGEAGCLVMLGSINTDQGDYLAGRVNQTEALRLSQMIGNRMGESIILGNLGINYADLGEYEEARDCQQRALAISQEIGDREGESFAYSNLTLLYFHLGEFERSQEVARKALAIHQEIDDRRSQGYTLTYLAHTLAALQQWQAAQAAYTQAADIRRELGAEAAVIDDVAGLAYVAWQTADLPQALTYTNTVLQWIEANGTDGIEYPVQVYFVCSQILQEANDPRAAEMLQRAYDLLQEQLARIQNEDGRQRFLQKVAFNHQLMAAWEQKEGNP